jgi:Ulp1 family protease
LDSTPQSKNQTTLGSGSGEDNSVDDPDITTTTTTTTTSRNDRDVRFFFQKNSNSKKKEGKNNKEKRARKEGASNFVDLSKDTTPYSPDKTILLEFLSFDGRQQILRQKDISRLTGGKTDEERYTNDELVNFYLSYSHTEFNKAHPKIARRIFIFSSHFYSQLRGHGRFNYKNVEAWPGNVNVFEEVSLLVIPVNLSNHWSVVLVHMQKFIVNAHLDSLCIHKEDKSVVGTIRKYLRHDRDRLQLRDRVNLDYDSPIHDVSISYSTSTKRVVTVACTFVQTSRRPWTFLVAQQRR